ncbi:hypothetical protein PC119_g13192 [Phytophthora cactorum]|uniref:Uncharacterized protein n=1 Tax=Phytophthora cactorum TaxID=29920 RepID=A0A8T1BMC2_9STRA|nr:hypothetical protein PC114_g11441 [Phytophthora cactorum]KAG2906224.1 hypothetical protein PC117_g20556 [Phytophthora cactorum]KAG3011609.1 hypothetical protein PC119_g13192 [Phytophthora cactorum]KAG3203713.1 hypothetical protein PC128_g2434 [Phytophthora cactorum]KAG4044395.1 hypothetical protein PC123_g20156 [Phytophthora cactorum]
MWLDLPTPVWASAATWKAPITATTTSSQLKNRARPTSR